MRARGQCNFSSWSLLCGWHDKLSAGAERARPPAGDGFEPGIKANSFGSMHVMISKNGSFPAPERMKGHWHRNRYVDAHHADFHLFDKRPGCRAIARINRRPISVFMFIDQ